MRSASSSVTSITVGPSFGGAGAAGTGVGVGTEAGTGSLDETGYENIENMSLDL